MRTLLPLFTLLSLLFPLTALHADEAADKDQLREMEKSCAAALVKGEYQVLDNILAEDWVILDEAGEIHKRDEIFKSLKNGELKYVSYDLGEMEIHVVGDTAVVIGHGHPRGQFRGEAFEENEVYTDTFARVRGKWLCIVTHSVDVPDTK